jgi:hypothetical protein
MAVVVVALTAYRLWPIDGIPSVSGAHTVFAKGYSDAGWKSVRLGATRSEAYARLGTPTSIMQIEGDRTVEEWSMGVMSPSQYRRRALGFEGGIVVFKKAEVTRTRPGLNIVYPAGPPWFE